MWERGRAKGKITAFSRRTDKILGRDDVVVKILEYEGATCLI